MADLHAAEAARSALEESRRAALALIHGAGAQRTQEILERSAADLERRIASIAPSLGEDTFTLVQLRTTLAQVQHVIKTITVPALRGVVLEEGNRAAKRSASNTVDYMRKADRAFRGVGEQPLALDAASMMESGMQGARSSVLSRLAHGVEKRGARPSRVRRGILARYGIETIAEFEHTMQVGLVSKKSWIDMREDITKVSPFLQGKPKYWAHRIVRTEVMSAYSASSHHAIVSASKKLTGMLKILCETFDDRTAADSYADHGQVRLPEEEFENWYGAFLHPPGRPNDRAIVVPHRTRWPLPPSLQPRDDDEVSEAWAREGRKGEPPERPLMSTVEGFGGEG